MQRHLLALLGFGAGSFGLGAPADAAPCRALRIEAALQASGAKICGQVHCALDQPSPGPQRLQVAAYPNTLRRPTGPDELVLQRWYPLGFAPAQMQLWTAEGPLGGAGGWRELTVPAGASEVSVHFCTQVPPRYDLFGKQPAVLFLLGGWHPLLNLPHRDPPVPIDYRIDLPEAAVGFVGRQAFAHAAASIQVGKLMGHDLPLWVGKPGSWEPVPLPDGGGALLPHPPRPPQGRAALQAPAGSQLQPLAGEFAGSARRRLLQALRQGADFARRQGLQPLPLWVVVAPLEGRLVLPFSGGLLISQQVFAPYSLGRLQTLQRAAIWRAQLAAYALPACRARESASPAPALDGLPANLVADALGTGLRDALVAEQGLGAATSARAFVDSLALIPEIDTLLWAPQIPFEEAYFPPIDEASGLQGSLQHFTSPWPAGRLLHEKLRDRLGEAALRQLEQAYLQQMQPLRRLLPAEVRRDLRAFLGPYPRLNYVLSVRPPDRSAAMPVAHVDLQHTTDALPLGHEASVGSAKPPEVGGPAMPVEPVEPVDVEFVDANHASWVGRRLGPGDVPCPTAARLPLDHILLDPNLRLVEHRAPPGFSPSFDNRLPHPWRLLLNNFTGLVAVTGHQLAVGADLGLRRLHDLRYDADLYLMGSANAWAAEAGLSRHLGAGITPLRLAGSLRASLGLRRLVPSYNAPLGANEVNLRLGIGFDNRIALLTSNQGRALQASLGFGMGRKTDASGFAYAQVGAAALQIWPLTTQQALVLRLRGDAILGRAPQQDLLPLGGRNLGARGFEVEETRGPHRLLLSGEWRHVVDRLDRTSLGPLGVLQRLDGALFADAAYFPTRPLGCDRQSFLDVGYGLRFFINALHLLPASLQVDVGMPITRCATERARRLPVTVYAAFVQSFSSF